MPCEAARCKSEIQSSQGWGRFRWGNAEQVMEAGATRTRSRLTTPEKLQNPASRRTVGIRVSKLFALRNVSASVRDCHLKAGPSSHFPQRFRAPRARSSLRSHQRPPRHPQMPCPNISVSLAALLARPRERRDECVCRRPEGRKTGRNRPSNAPFDPEIAVI